MDRFVSNFTNRVDAKGRVSVPATFRAVLARDGHEGVFVHPALDLPALDAGGNRLLHEIDTFLAAFPIYSDEREQLSAATFGTSEILKLDGEGRIMLTDAVREHAGLTDTVSFVGLGQKFQIWEPERFREHLSNARSRVREARSRFMAASGPIAASSVVVPPGARGT